MASDYNFSPKVFDKFVRLWVIVFLIGTSLSILGGMVGGDLLDGMAGGRRENTLIQSILVYGGYYLALTGLAVIVVSFLARSTLYLIHRLSKKSVKFYSHVVYGVVYWLKVCLGFIALFILYILMGLK